MNRLVIVTLYCEVGRRLEDHIQGMGNFSLAWLEERAKGSGHAHFLIHTDCPFVLDEHEKKRMEHAFEMCYVLAREGLAFLMYPLFHALAERQGVGLGTSYIQDSQ